MTEQTELPENQAGVAVTDPSDIKRPTAVDAAFSDDQVRLFSVRGLIHRFPPGVEYNLKVENPVPLYNVDGKPLGFARVFPVEGGGIMAEALLEYSCPERLSIETDQKLFYHEEANVEYFRAPVHKPFPKELLGTTLPGVGLVTEAHLNPKMRPVVVIEVRKLMLCEEPRLDADIAPVVQVPEEQSA